MGIRSFATNQFAQSQSLQGKITTGYRRTDRLAVEQTDGQTNGRTGGQAD